MTESTTSGGTYYDISGDKQLSVTMTGQGHLVITVTDFDGGFDVVRAQFVMSSGNVPEFLGALNSWAEALQEAARWQEP